MEHLRAAEPHEQTPAQFLNRPDTFVHGRFVEKDMHPSTEWHKMGYSMHAGTHAAALDRLEQLGSPRGGRKQHARFYAGTVDPKRMYNPPPSGDVHDHGDQEVTQTPFRFEKAKVTKPNSNEWRIKDQNEDWNETHHDKYYRNNAEDIGSTSVILSARGDQTNFKSWRRHVSDALQQGKAVPKHVEAVYHESGGDQGSVYHVEPGFRPEVDYRERRLPYAATEQSLPGSHWHDSRPKNWK
jgi:hypothetical protein